MTASYNERELVKAHGARFDFTNRYWYYEGDSLPEALEEWYAGQCEPTGTNANAGRQGQTGTNANAGRQGQRGTNANAGRQGQRGTNANAGQRDQRLVDTQARMDLTAGQNVQIELQEEGDILGAINQNFMTVTGLNEMIAGKYSEIEAFEHILVKGEVTNFRGKTGPHYYFDIKDDNCQISCRLWEATARRVLHFELERGQMVGISGRLEYYKNSGTSNLIVGDIRNLGEGMAMLAYMQLKQRLNAEGLFAPEHKKAIPVHPKKVGIITSKNGDAIKDICQKAAERNPYVQLVLYHVQVQGRNAVPSILRGIQVMDQAGCDTIIIGRGGGTLEELMVYDDESIVRAVYAAVTPIISAVGHQAHEPLLDLVADKRVSTPTSAAELALPNVMIDVERLQRLRREMTGNMRNQLERRQAALRERIAVMEQYHPERKLKDQKARLEKAKEELQWNLERIYGEKKIRLSRDRDQLKWAFQRLYSEKKHRFEILLTNLNGLSPTAKLVKGFGYISHDDQPLTSVTEVKEGDELLIRIHDGEIGATVNVINKKQSE